MFLPLFLVSVNAFSSGAPICSIVASTVQRGHGFANNPNLGFGLRATAVGNTVEIQVTSRTQSHFNGILLYVTGSSGQRLGTFRVDGNFRGIATCSASALSTITHANGSPKPLGSKFVWNGPAGSTASAIVAWRAGNSGAPQWQIVQSISLPAVSGTAAGASGQAPNAGQTTPTKSATPAVSSPQTTQNSGSLGSTILIGLGVVLAQ
jgi:hypothetical protein